ncbi:YdcF family protein [Brumimicrobium mesophilum]|uniref:YdcF family protein n=1 Tax=Brumimicrobium mesophilum TaxID=392717 RepID=UPI00131E8604|nr:ElyC/SanA/YdcF family protein [Brumimicrobium mesophilum]
MIDFLKGIPDVSLYFLTWGSIALWYRKKPFKYFKAYLITGIVLFLLSSTTYLPKILINSIESKYNPIEFSELDSSQVYHILVLGAGSTTDPRLPSTMNISSEALKRLIEGIRVYTHLNNSILVTSAYSAEGDKSLARLSKEAAISLGVNEKQVKMLETPTTTLEEANAFKDTFGTNKKIILVTSALHMPRAIEIFKDKGLDVIAAPADYLYKDGQRNRISFPSSNSIELMNAYHITVLKKWYYKIFKK